eukprot:TRINITY_DN18277_c0_g1_i1.p1 TRINITY_DN18277_c0_g1~~TRINITY_DN18277_c0_g1_i1.p1  ORF type:complete len:118 (-),score=29.94 TRINITY_DN18277_c0_g1_i1:88-441(-)
MKDRQGVNRGACQQGGCGCSEYHLPTTGNACDYCGHFPVNHKQIASTVSTDAKRATNTSSPAKSASPAKSSTNNFFDNYIPPPTVATASKSKTKKKPVDPNKWFSQQTTKLTKKHKD